MTIEQIRTDCAALYTELMTEYHLAGAGLKDGLDTSSVLERYHELAEPERLAEARAALGNTVEPDERRRLTLLTEHLASLYADYRARSVVDQVQNAEAEATAVVDGETIPFYSLVAQITNEADRPRRLRLADARIAVMDRFEPLLLEQVEVVQNVAVEQGYANHVERCRDLCGLPLARLREVTQAFLEATDDLYRRGLDRLLERLGVAPDEAMWADLLFGFGAKEWDERFPADELLPRVTRFVEAMGLDPTAGGHISFDLEVRPRKSPRAFCSVIEAPSKVVLVVRPVGGVDDYEAFLHELGHCLHYGHVEPELPWEYRHLGDNSVTEAFAFLFENLTLSPAWLREVNGLDEPGELAFLNALGELMMVRKYCAQLDFELDLFRSDAPQSLKASYAARLSRATGVKHAPESYLVAIDPDFYSARYLQGWLFEATLCARLTRELGERWFLSRDAGELLRSLWSRGQEPRVGEMFEHLGVEPLSAEALLHRFEVLL